MIYLLIPPREIHNEFNMDDYPDLIFKSPHNRLKACVNGDINEILNNNFCLVEIQNASVSKVFTIDEVKKLLLLL